MATPPLSAEILIDTLRLWEENKCVDAAAARSIGVNVKTFTHRRSQAQLRFPNGIPDQTINGRWAYPRMIAKNVPGTTWLIVSDLHIWDGDPPLIYKAAVKLAKTLKVDGIILNGDIIDGARISRHPQMRGSKAPKIEKGKMVGAAIATKAKELGIDTVVFDRGGYIYHGRIAAVAEAARESGLEF